MVSLDTSEERIWRPGTPSPVGQDRASGQTQLQAVGGPGRWSLACEKDGNKCQVVVQAGDGIRKI